MTSPDSPAHAAPRHALLFDPQADRASVVAVHLAAQGLVASLCHDGAAALALVYNDPPDLIVIHQDMPPKGGCALARQLRNDNVFAHIPILLLLSAEGEDELAGETEYPFDDFTRDDAPPEQIGARAALSIVRAHRQLDANPLTRLPGNNSIIRELESRLANGEEFATVYIDLDHFKAFNDRYGFSRGDEALKMTARLVVNSVRGGSPGDHYIGHVGGDDFIFLIPGDCVDAVCRQLIANFDAVIGSLYDDDDRRAGCIHSVNRKGDRETFPMMAISLAVVVNTGGQFSHPGEISAVAAEIKKQAKKDPNSNYVVDRREHRRTSAPDRRPRASS